METDERFKHLAADPRFRTLRKKERKVQIDERFQSMFTDERFTLKYSKDKRGRNLKKASGEDLKKYYSLKDDDKSEESGKVANKIHQKIEEEDDVEPSDNSLTDLEEGDDDTDNEEKSSASEVSSSSDESESEEELHDGIDGSIELDPTKINYDWQPLDHDAETAETTTSRLAIQNLDWDFLDVKDIYTLIHSVRPPLSVKIFISEFGKERLKKEEIEGPKELIEMSKVDEIEEEYNQLRDKMRSLKNLEPKTYKVNEYEDADEQMDLKNEEVRERIRKYQLNRMKYYYAVVEFDSIESAEVVYKELDGMEYEGSSLELDLRFIPDNIEFDPIDMTAECNKVPDLTTYKAPQFINTALQQTTAKFSWDETDIKRQEQLRKAYTKGELEKDDLEAYLGSETESEDENEEFDDSDDGRVSFVTGNSEARANKYKMLLQKLDEESAAKKKVDVDVEWENTESEGTVELSHREEEDFESEEELEQEEEEYDESDNGSNEEEEEESSRIRRRKKKKKPTSKSAKRRNKKLLENDQQHQGSDEDRELDLLVMDVDKTKHDEFKFNPDDERFKAIYESGLYNIDPSHSNFKRTQAFEVIAEKKREKRQKTSSLL